MTKEFSDWITLAEKKKIFLTPASFKKLGIKKHDIVRADYIRFLAIEYGKKYKISLNKIYTPKELFSKIKATLIPNKKSENQKRYVMRGNPYAIEENVTVYSGIYSEKNKKPHEVGLFKIKGEPWLNSGSGDGWSRWLLWKDLDKMPPLWISS